MAVVLSVCFTPVVLKANRIGCSGNFPKDDSNLDVFPHSQPLMNNNRGIKISSWKMGLRLNCIRKPWTCQYRRLAKWGLSQEVTVGCHIYNWGGLSTGWSTLGPCCRFIFAFASIPWRANQADFAVSSAVEIFFRKYANVKTCTAVTGIVAVTTQRQLAWQPLPPKLNIGVI